MSLLKHGSQRIFVTSVTANFGSTSDFETKKRARRPATMLILKKNNSLGDITLCSLGGCEFGVGLKATFADINALILFFF
jgi:hypothetical protein